MISKELLSLMEGEEVDTIFFRPLKNYLIYTVVDEPDKDIVLNLDTLTRLCKEWCFKKEYILASAFIVKGFFSSSYCLIKRPTMSNEKYVCATHGDTELEAVIKATEWVYANIKKDKQ